MIERYCTAEMTAIWAREAKYRRWLEVEIAVCETLADFGEISKVDVESIKKFASFDLARCDELERETKHDLMAFVRNVSEEIQRNTADTIPNPSRWVHFGVTSYDIIDTALGMMMRDSCEVIDQSIQRALSAIADLSKKHGKTPCIGRTHGIHAEAITFGHKLHGWSEELSRSRKRLANAKQEISIGKISGPVGIHAHIDQIAEAAICARLGLSPDPNSTQIVARDRHAALMCVLAVLAGSIERIATELRNLQRTEILEVQEEFVAGQTGSSAMPHKRNPWNSETLCGLARIVRGNAHAMLESVMTWHERDLTNSSLERIVLPDTFQLVDFMLNRLTRILSGLQVFSDNMKRNLRLMGDLVYSEHVMVSLIRAGLTREEAYKIAQRNAAAAWGGDDFRESIAADPEIVSRLSKEEIAEIFSLEHHLRNATEPS